MDTIFHWCEKSIYRMFGLEEACSVPEFNDFWDMLPVLYLKEQSVVVTVDGILASYIELSGLNTAALSSQSEFQILNTMRYFFESMPSDLSASFITLRLKDNQEIECNAKNCTKKHQDILNAWSNGFKTTYSNRFFLVIQSKKSPWINEEMLSVSWKSFFQKKETITDRYNKFQEDDVPESFLKFINSATIKLSEYKAKLLKGDQLYGCLASILGMEKKEIRREKDWRPFLNRFCSAPEPSWDPKHPEVLNLRKIKPGANNVSACLVLEPDLGGPKKIVNQPLDKITSVDREFIMIQRIELLDPEKTKKTMKNKLKIFNMLNMRFKRSELERIEQLNESILSDEFKLCNFAAHIHLIERTESELEAACNELQAAFSKQINPFHLTRESEFHGSIWWSQWPGWERYNPRRFLMATTNLINLVGCKAQSTGQSKTPWSDFPICKFRTADKSVHNFSFHKNSEKGSNGNTLIIGGSGFGKTTLISFLLAQAGKIQNLKTVCFDHFSGMKISTEAQGGNYVDFSDKKNQINPFHLENTEENIKFLTRWVGHLIGGVEAHELRGLELSIGQMMKDGDSKKIDNLLIGTNSDRIRHLLNKWSGSSQNSNYFGGDYDSLDFSNRRVVFDLASIVKKPDVIGPMCEYLFYRIHMLQHKDPSPGIMFFDEASIYFSHPLLSEIALEAFRSYRKRDWIVVAAIQSLDDLIDLDMSQKVIENVETLILFPTPSASEELYKKHLCLSESEFNWLIKPQPDVRQVLVKKQDGESFVLDIDLSPLGDQIKYFDSNTQSVKDWESEKEDRDDYSFDFPKQMSFFVKVPESLNYETNHIALGAKRALVSDISEYLCKPMSKGPLVSKRIKLTGEKEIGDFLCLNRIVGSKGKAVLIAAEFAQDLVEV